MSKRRRYYNTARKVRKVDPPICPYCGGASRLVTGADIYRNRPDLADKQIYQCRNCPDAYVGCHPGTVEPLGRLSDSRLRAAKMRAHAAFDPLWKAGGAGRRAQAYLWLSRELAMEPKHVHIGMMDPECCDRVVELCKLAAATDGFTFSMELT